MSWPKHLGRADLGKTCGRLVYSYGPGNSLWHPFQDVLNDHSAVWNTDLRTANRDASGLGHVHLYWRDTDPDADPPCGGSACQLNCHQR